MKKAILVCLLCLMLAVLPGCSILAGVLSDDELHRHARPVPV